jgi:hypothetical protein
MKRRSCAIGALKRTLKIEDEGKEKVVLTKISVSSLTLRAWSLKSGQFRVFSALAESCFRLQKIQLYYYYYQFSNNNNIKFLFMKGISNSLTNVSSYH